MELLPPVSRADVATKQDLVLFETRLEAHLGQMDARSDQVDARFARVDDRFDQVDDRFADRPRPVKTAYRY